VSNILYIQQPLVKYRRHGANVSFFVGGDDCTSFEHRERRLLWVDEQTIRAYDNMVADLAVLVAKGRLSASDGDRLSREARRIKNYYVLEHRLMEANLLDRAAVLFAALFNGHAKAAARLSPRLLPRPLYRALYSYTHKK
jgi:hypothetical protein